MKYEVYIDDSPSYLQKRIFITYKNGTTRYVAKPVILEFEAVDYASAQPSEPTLAIPDSEDLLEAFAVALSKHNVKLPEQSFTEGKLTATEKHLEDMRKLVFK